MRRTIACCGLAGLPRRPRRPPAGVAAVWAVSDGEKVERDDRAHPLKARNAVWDGQQRAPRRRAQRDRGLPGDRRGGRRGLQGPLRLAAGAAPARRERGDRLHAAGRRPDALGRPADPALLRPLHERHHGEPRGLGLEAGKPGRAARHHGLEAGAARARERAGRARRLPARGGARARPGAVGRGLRRPRPARPASTRARSRSRPTGRRRRCPSSCASSTSRCPTRTACR